MQRTTDGLYKLRILKYSTAAIASVVLIEVSIGLAVGSLVIVTDGLHALFDALANVALFIAISVSLRPPDKEHMFGHEKFEPIGGLIGGIVLLGVASFILFEAAIKIIENKPYLQLGLEYAGFIAIGYTFCMDIFRVVTFTKARHLESSTIKAGFYHAIADLGSTALALFGFGLATLGFYNGDSFGSIILSLMLAYLSIKVIWTSGMELSDAIPLGIADEVNREIHRAKEVKRCENLRVRKAGAKTFVEATIQVSDYLDLQGAHNIATEIEEKIRTKLENAQVIIHTEPCRERISTEKLVKVLTKEVSGVKEVHHTTVVYAKGGLHIILHAIVDSNLSVEEAHEIAQEIKKNIHRTITRARSVTVHIEPLNDKAKKASVPSERELKRVIRELFEDYPKSFHLKRMFTYISGKKRYINLVCCFSRQLLIEEVHNIASDVERLIKEKWEDVVVTVHTEPE